MPIEITFLLPLSDANEKMPAASRHRLVGAWALLAFRIIILSGLFIAYPVVLVGILQILDIFMPYTLLMIASKLFIAVALVPTVKLSYSSFKLSRCNRNGTRLEIVIDSELFSQSLGACLGVLMSIDWILIHMY